MTTDGRWMVAEAKDGVPKVEYGFVGSFDDALAIAAAWNRHAMDEYNAETMKQIIDKIPRPTIDELVKMLKNKD
jgi:hypothetical protein